MSWIEPKTKWIEQDKFNAVDYNRIKGNIAFVKTITTVLFPAYELEDMGNDKVAGDYMHADEINKFVKNINTINKSTFKLPMTLNFIYAENGRTMLASELTDMESLIYQLFTEAEQEIRKMNRLPMNLGLKGGL